MIKRCVRTCDLCQREVEAGQFVRRHAEPDGHDLMMVLLENQGTDFELFEDSDGTVALDTCLDCATRITYDHGHSPN
jgi:hypothetical protein